MLNQSPKYSIIVPTYNRANFIVKTINSILSQNYENFEIIIVDDGSTDNTEEIVSDLSDTRIRYLWKTNKERGAARNFGVQHSTGEYITFLDSDDLLYSNHFEEANKLISHNPGLEVFHLAYQMKDGATGKIIRNYNDRKGNLNEQILKGNLLSCIGVFIKREIALKYKFNENRAFSGTEDWLLWLKLASRYSFEYSNEITACMIDHESRSVLNFSEKELDDRTSILRQELISDGVFINKFGKNAVSRIHAHMLTYSALHLALSEKRIPAIRRLIKAVFIHPAEALFKKRTLAILKHLVPI